MNIDETINMEDTFKVKLYGGNKARIYPVGIFNYAVEISGIKNNKYSTDMRRITLSRIELEMFLLLASYGYIQ
ncbi:MAG: hypothetical protein NC548_47510 [Lachnospiraceae bacterium]|nr:hypothetical protein [Lachnospiraceae bacterium]